MGIKTPTREEVARIEKPVRAKGYIPYRQLLFILPVFTFLLVFFVLPFANLFFISLSSGKTPTVPQDLSFQHYVKFLTDPFYVGVLLKTLRIALTTTILALVIAYPVAYYMVRTSGRKRAYLTLLILGPLLINVVSRTYGWLLVLAPSGVIPSLLKTIGFSEPPRLLFTETATVIGLTHVFLAFMVLSLAAALENIDPSLLLAAQSLGASKFTAFMRVTLPLSLPGITAGSVIVFALSTSAFATPALLGGPFNKLMSYLVYQQTVALSQWTFGAAIAFILFAVTFLSVFTYFKFTESSRTGVAFR